MGDLINLDEIRKSKGRSDTELELQSLYDNLDDMIKEIDVKYSFEFGSSYAFPGHTIEDIDLSPSLSSLYNSYYSLLSEERKDLAELVLEIIKMI